MKCVAAAGVRPSEMMEHMKELRYTFGMQRFRLAALLSRRGRLLDKQHQQAEGPHVRVHRRTYKRVVLGDLLTLAKNTRNASSAAETTHVAAREMAKCALKSGIPNTELKATMKSYAMF